MTIDDITRCWDWSWPLENHRGRGRDHRRAAAVVALAAVAARRRIDGNWRVVPDRPRGRLFIHRRDRGGAADRARAVIDLRPLANDLRSEPVATWPGLVETSIGDIVTACLDLSAPALGGWAEAAPRLLVRVVRSGDAGPLGRPLGSGLALDVGLAVDRGHPRDEGPAVAGPAIVTIDGSLLEAWGRSPWRVRKTAADNTRRWVRPAVTTIEPGPGRPPLYLLSGGPWTTGAIVDPAQALARPPPSGRPWAGGRLWVSVLDSQLLLVFRSDPTPSPAVGRLIGDWFRSPGRGFPANLHLVSDRREQPPSM